VAQNRSCATLSKLRWVLIQNGVQLLHPEHERQYTMYSLGVTDDAGAWVGRLQGIWLKGIPVVILMQLVEGSELTPLHYDVAMMVLRHFKFDAETEAEVRLMSADYTR